MKIYIAAPFFNTEQLYRVEKIERMLRDYNIEHFSPRSMGILKNTKYSDERERQFASEIIFQKNIEMLQWADIVLAVMDDKDSGTTYEIGYAGGSGKTVIGFTADAEAPHNLMLAHAFYVHLSGWRNLDAALQFIAAGKLLMLQAIHTAVEADT